LIFPALIFYFCKSFELSDMMTPTDDSLMYCESYFKYSRNQTADVVIGNIGVGGNNPIRVQSMTTTNTLDTEATVEQSIRIIEAGGELVRMTTQGRREANNLKHIHEMLRHRGYNTPLVADIHFNPNAAEIAARLIEKVRINPGNFADGAKKFREHDTTEDAWQEGLATIREKLIPFLAICKANGTAIRIGTNHGSLSDRIMSRFGDTPEGMVESCMEYLRICREEDFHRIVLSIKASNTRVMVHTVRLLVARMKQEGMSYPLHLGVTEAGNGEDGRIKSAVGIGALLLDGLGDTIRVSLTEDPEDEIPVARQLVNHIANLEMHEPIIPVDTQGFSPFSYQRRSTYRVDGIGGNQVPVIIHQVGNKAIDFDNLTLKPDYYYCDDVQQVETLLEKGCKVLVPYGKASHLSDANGCFPVLKPLEFKNFEGNRTVFVKLAYGELNHEMIEKLRSYPDAVVLATAQNINGMAEQRALIWALQAGGLKNPVVIYREYVDEEIDVFQLKSATDTGILFLDGLADGLFIRNAQLTDEVVISTQLAILQASRVRFSRTEFISCPGCGRTLFELQQVTAAIKTRTSHLKGLKIGIMGCIVNGIGEMADADYGYVGSGPGRISLFKQKELIKRNIPTEQALEELIALIKEGGDWVEP
jgi:(E)-4-hydroxy-3-methylbut-2-enyl-diphosphate synthase